MILAAEESFARAVALGLIIKRPLSSWHFLIPGMFIFDFLRRSAAIRRNSALFLFPRKLALDAAHALYDGKQQRTRLAETEEALKEWLTSLQLYSLRMHQTHMEQIRGLIDHYSRLLDVQGKDYRHLVRNAYKTRKNYRTALSQLASLEREVDEAIAELEGNSPEGWRRLRAEQEQVEVLRAKELSRIFQ